MTPSVRCLLLFALVCAAPAAHADALDDLRAKLAGMNAQGPFAAAVTVHSTRVDGDEDAPETTQAEIALRVAIDADGLHLDYPAKLVQRLGAEAQADADDADAPTPVGDLVEQIGPARLHNMLDFAPYLLRHLKDVTLTSQAETTYAGQPAQVLVLDVQAHFDEDIRDAIDEYSSTLTVWLNARGMPVATRQTFAYEGSKFFIDFAGGSQYSYALRRMGSRLVALERRGSRHGSGFGQSSKNKLKIVLRPDQG